MRVIFRYKNHVLRKEQRDFIESQSQDLNYLAQLDSIKWNIEYSNGEYSLSAKIFAPKMSLFSRGCGQSLEEAAMNTLDALEIQMAKFGKIKKGWREQEFKKTA